MLFKDLTPVICEYMKQLMGFSGRDEQADGNSMTDRTSHSAQLNKMDTDKKTGEKKKSKFGGFFGSSEKKESTQEYYARMERESEQREAESRKKRQEEQRKKDEEKRINDERRKVEEEVRRRAEEVEEAERREEAEERARRAKEDLERQLTMQREDYARQREQQRKMREIELQRAKDENESQAHRRRTEDERMERERRELEMDMERRNQEALRHRMQQLQHSNQDATSTLERVCSAATADAAAFNGKMIQELAAENESQRLLNLRAEQMQRELERAAIEEKATTSMFIKGVDDSLHAAALEMERKKEEQFEEGRRREKEREESRVRYEADWKSKTEREEEALQEKTKLYEETSDMIRREKGLDSARHEEEMERMREAHAVRVDELLEVERRKMEEINQMKKAKEEERRMHWNRMRDAFVQIMRNRYAGMMSSEMEQKWDDRFNQLRRSHDPVKEAFSDLESIPLRKSDLPSSLVQFEAHLESLRMSLTTLEDIMSSEKGQVDIWKQQQPDAHFLIDLGSTLETILSTVGRVRREIEMVMDGILMNRENEQELERIFKLAYLGNAMKELTNAVDSIPSVYELNKKYANGSYRTETTF